MASSNVSNVANHFPTVNEGFITTVGAPGVSSGGSSVPLTSVSGLTNGTVFVGIVDPGLATQQVFTGTVDTGGAQITDVEWTRGDDVAHSTGATVVDYITGTAINMITKGILTFANQDGTLKAIVAPSATISGNVGVGGTLTVTGTTTVDALTTGNVVVGGRSTAQVQSISSSSTLTPNVDDYNIGECVALATNTTIDEPSGTPVNQQTYTLRLMDNGTIRTLAWNATYVGIGVTLPSATVANKVTVVTMAYSSSASRWEVLSISRET